MSGTSSSTARRLSRVAEIARVALLAALVATAVAVGARDVARAAPLAPPVEQAAGAAILGVVNRVGAQVLSAPEGGDAVAALDLGTIVNALGRSADNQWVVVTTNDGATGWMAAADLVIFGLEDLPVMLGEGAEGGAEQAAPTVPAAPAQLPTPTPRPPTPTPTPVPPTPTFTPTFTPVPPTPTFTATPVPPTATPPPTRAVATERPAATRASSSVGTPGRSGASIVAVVGAQGAPLYASPGGETLRTLPVGTALNADARSADGAYLRVRANGGATGWVDAARVVAFNAQSLPVADGSAPAPEAGAAPAIESVTTPTRAAPAAATAAPVEEAAAVTATMGVTTTADGAAPRPTPRDDGRPRAVVQMTGLRLNVRAEPSTDATIITKALPREEFIVLGRNAAGDWVQIELPESEGGAGWVAADYVTTSVPLGDLPVVGSAGTGEVRAAPAAGATSSAAAVVPSLALPTATPATRAAARTAPTGLDGVLAFQDGRNNIYTYNLGTGELRWLTNGYDPAVSPDGTEIAFTRGDGHNNGIYRINLDGSGEQKVFGEGQLLRSPKWNPAGDRIVYSRLSGSYKCYDVEFIGCKSFHQLLGEFPFLIIPELRERFFRDVERKEFPNWGLSRVSPSGEEFRDIAALDSAVAPDWNEAGIVYESTAGIEITEDTPEGDTRAVIQEDWDHDPDWQPEGGRILFQSKEGDHWEIWSVTPEGGGLVALTRPETTLVDKLPSNVAPAWSYDGQHVVYLSSRTDEEEHGPWRLWVMNTDGSGKRRLPIDIEVDYSFASEQVADWGPPQ
jgi:hypothetical protein